MKRIKLLLLFLTGILQAADAQVNWGDYSQSYQTGLTDKAANIGLFTLIRKDNNSFWGSTGDQTAFSELQKDSSFRRIRPQNIIARTTFDTARVHFFLHGINPKNAGSYEFRVLEYPDKKVIPWSAITRFSTNAVTQSSGLPTMAYLGGFKTILGKMLVIDVRKKGTQDIVASSVIAWVAIKPLVKNIYTASELNTFLKKLARPYAVKKDSNKYSISPVKPKEIPSKVIHMAPKDNNLIFYIGTDIYHKEQLAYELNLNGKVNVPWKNNDFDNSFIWLKELSPGTYRLKIRYNAQPEHVVEYQFIINPEWYQSTRFYLIAGMLTTLLLSGFLFLVLFIREKRKTHKALSNKDKVQLELKSIYAQLNPHFVFNALSSIQGLINKQDIPAANKYLSDFARLMRDSLNNSNKEEVSLQEEIRILDTYLRLEQLRFGFNYTIETDRELNIYDTSIPSLLLQPLIENAVKHGVSALQQKGMIYLHFYKEQEALIVTLSDNGTGFNVHQTGNGFGLKLTFDRIKLLNELRPGQQIHLEFMENSGKGTFIRLSFNNWFI